MYMHGSHAGLVSQCLLVLHVSIMRESSVGMQLLVENNKDIL